MPINFQTLRVSENNLRKMLCEYFEHIVFSQKKVLKYLKDKKITPERFQKVSDREKLANQYEAKILEEASWILSKDNPRAAHLRFIIAVIRSIRDLERMGDYVENLAIYFYKSKKIDTKMWTIAARALEQSIIVINAVYENMVSGPNQTPELYATKVIPLYKIFSRKYLTYLRQVGKIAFTSNKNKTNNLYAFSALKNIERNCDHALNIFENFIYISSPDYYFTKETRRDQKK